MVQAVNEAPSPVPPTGMEADAMSQSRRGFEALWAVLINPLPLLVFAVLLLLMLLASAWLPQLPGQLRSEPLAAGRWVTTTAESLGALGSVLRMAGLFDVLHSLLFRLLLTATAFLLLVQSAYDSLVALQLRRLPALLDIAVPGGEALPVVLPFVVQRWRAAAPGSPLTVAAQCEAQTQPWATHLERRTLRVQPSPPQAEMLATTDTTSVILEERLLAWRGVSEAVLRPLLPVGMLLAVGLVWWYSAVSYQFAPAPLLPGERTSDSVLGVAFEYVLTYPTSGVIGPVLSVTKDARQELLPLTPTQLTLDDVVVTVQPGAPAILVRMLDGAPWLAQPGQATAVAELGLGFPNPGSEQALVIPHVGVGLRIIRQDNGTATAADDAFVVEVFQGSSEEPVQRVTINGSQVERIKTPRGELPLSFIPMPMFQVRAYTAPGLWWLAPAFILVGVGALGFRRRPIFLLAQAGPWPIERTVVIIQTNHAVALEGVRRTLVKPS